MQSTIGAQSPVKRRRCQPKGFDCTCTYYDQDADDQLGCRSRAMDAESRRYRDLTQASSAFEHPGQWIAAYAQVRTCEGLRTPAMTTPAPRADSRRRQSANGRNRERWASTVRRVLRGFDVGTDADEYRWIDARRG